MSGDASTTSVETALRRELEATRWRLYELEATEGDVVVERLISRLSDGLRGPLSVVTGVADMVDQVDLDATTLRHASTSLAASSRHLRGVIDDLGDYADLLSRNLVLREVPADPRLIIEELQRRFEPWAASKGIALEFEVADDVPPTVLMDPERVRQAVGQFVSNGIKFSAHGLVSVRVQTTQISGTPWLRFEVQDSGAGIAPADQERIFRVFERAEVTPGRRTAGVGVGLPVARQFAELMGGGVGLRSQPKEGSLFWFDLPLREIAMEDLLARWTEAADREGEPAWLIVDASEANRDLVTLFGERLQRSVVAAGDVEEAVQRAGELGSRLSLVLLTLPEDEELAAARVAAWKLHSVAKDVRVVGVCGADAREAHRKGQTLGLDGAVALPLTVHALQSLLEGGDAPEQD